jgi:16S rRNA (guanine527-N7)-methyltransferase
LSSSRFPRRDVPPPQQPPKKPDEGGSNALWRIPQWFPKLGKPIQDALRTYHTELLKFNAKVNLISRNTERDADEVHFADCLMGAQAMLKGDLGKQVYDLGSGNGLPGLILAILDPQREYLLVESDARKGEFLKHMIHVLGLKNTQLLSVRLETLKETPMKIAVSRGLASISKTCLLLNKIFPVGGKFYHFKGTNWSSEIAELPSQLITVWNPELVAEFSLPVSQARRAIVSTTKRL